jgi:endonuclease/exonuclease/phosphatase family metal-dependent hydrolase
VAKQNQRDIPPPSIKPGSDQTGRGAGDRELLTILTYNLWHALNPDGPVRFAEQDTPTEREARLQTFLHHARELNPDVMFLEEVNPAPRLARRIARELDCDAHFTVDNAGIKIGAFGPPFNLRSGLAILAKKALRLRRRGGCKLSGGFGFVRRWLSLQGDEFRHAIAAEATIDGRRILLLGAHLHHGPEADADIRAAIERLVAEKKITARRAQEIVGIFNLASARREREIARALAFARRLAPAETPILFAGDFNASPDAPELLRLKREHGFRSATADDDPAKLLMSWDYRRNPNTHFFADFKPVHQFEPAAMAALQAAIVQQTKRLDYIFYRGFDGWLAPAAAGLFADQPWQGRLGSDHFGIWARFEKLG